jgi:hypothetical protein
VAGAGFQRGPVVRRLRALRAAEEHAKDWGSRHRKSGKLQKSVWAGASEVMVQHALPQKICTSVEPLARCPTLKCRLLLQALGFRTYRFFLWGRGGRFHHATGPASAGPLSPWRTGTFPSSGPAASLIWRQRRRRPPRILRGEQAGGHRRYGRSGWAKIWRRERSSVGMAAVSIARSELCHRRGVTIYIPGPPVAPSTERTALALVSVSQLWKYLAKTTGGRILRKGLGHDAPKRSVRFSQQR